MNNQKDFICTQEWEKPFLDELLHLAIEMKKTNQSNQWENSLPHKNLLMLFFSPSVRTHLSFLAAMTQLGGHAQYMTPGMGRFKSDTHPGEVIKDLATIMSGYMDAIGIRIMEKDVKHSGEGNALIRQYADYAKVPVINMADDKFHPCQGLADILTWAEWFSRFNGEVNVKQLQGKTLLLTWAKGTFARSWNSPQETLLLASRYGMNITLARPEGYDLDPRVYESIEQNLSPYPSRFNLIDSPLDGYTNADVVYSRHWLSTEAYQQAHLHGLQETDKALAHQDWITTQKKMARTNDAIFTHPMPVDRNNEAEDSVVDGPHSVIYSVAQNRLFIQKALLYRLLK